MIWSVEIAMLMRLRVSASGRVAVSQVDNSSACGAPLNEGREGRPVGTMFVVGDSRQVLRCAQQMVLNPFHGFSRTLRNVLDPSLAETIKEYAQIDGAFVIQNDGTVLSAGTYLAPKQSPIEMPAGLGARHTTAAGITRHTRAMAIAVSQSTGTVTIFRAGGIVMTLERAAATRW